MGINIKLEELIYPYFVVPGRNKKEKIRSFLGQFRFSADLLLEDIAEAGKLGIDKVLLFGVPDRKDALGSSAYEDNIVSTAVRDIKKEFPDMTVFTDVCLCAYTDHGHCGVINNLKAKNYSINNKKTLKVLAKIALSHAEAGADWVAPSAMAKGQVAAIRKALNENGYTGTNILGYSAKFVSNFYGPFREAADSSPKFGDRSAYQLDYADSDRAIREISDDIAEGADMVMVKPAFGYLDIIREAKARFGYPLAAYNVSGEYAMVKAYVKGAGINGQGAETERKLVIEILTSIKRAGADLIITYHAKDMARWLKE